MDELIVFLNRMVNEFEKESFILDDPIQIPHRFSVKQDIEIAAFFAATFAWGNRKMIINKTNDLLERMDNAPHDFIINHEEEDLKALKDFKHRTFQWDDLIFFIGALKKLYSDSDSLENYFLIRKDETNTGKAIDRFRMEMLKYPHLERSKKHLPSPATGSAAKRLNMFLRWMVRKSPHGVDFGIWENIPTAKLSCPLDVHSGRVARELGLLKRKQNDWKAVEELDANLRKLDPLDPVKYDFALFGLGVYDKLP